VRHGVGKLSSRATRLVQTLLRSEVGARSYGCPKSRESNGTHSGQFRDSISGVPGKCDIWMPLPWSNAEYTIGSKVVAYSRGPGRGVSCGPKCPWLVPTLKGVPECDPLPLSRVGSRERLPSPNFPQLHFGEPSSGFTPGLGSVSPTMCFPKMTIKF
jgi:hypothetical protein